MAHQVIWSPEALEELNDIGEYIARDTGFYAVAVVEKIFSTAEALTDFPFSGREAPEGKSKSIREKIVFNYRLIYRVDEEKVEIVAVIHGRRKRSHILKRIK